jgi:hypothetical protein
MSDERWAVPIGVLLLVVLLIGIPISIWSAREVWDKAWKRYLWLLICVFPVFNVLPFLFYLFHVTWRVSKGWNISRRWFWRIVASIPVLNPVLLPFYLWRERVRGLRPVAAVTSLYAAVVVMVVLLVSAGSPAVPIEAAAIPAKPALDAERKFISGDPERRPAICMSLSGGGIRSAAFSLGILKALHERGMLADVDVISAVSGGTYALSWLVLQPYYAASDATGATEPATAALASMFDPAGPFQQYLQKHARFVGNKDARFYVFWDATLGNFIRGMFVLLGVSDEVLVNGTGARRLYRERIQQTFHVHPRFTLSRWSALTEDERRTIGNEVSLSFEAINLLYGFEATNLLQLKPEESGLPGSLWIVRNVTFSDLRRFLSKAGGALPYPVFNLTLNVRPDRQFEGQIWPHSFELTPLGMGGPAVGYRAWREEADERLAAIESVNIAPAISGAAVSGYAQQGSSPRSSWLLRTLRVANIDLGYFVRNVFTSGPRSIYLSDGGHSDNLGLYALIRRKCERVLAVDAEEENGASKGKYEFAALTKLQRALDLEGIGQIKMDGGFTPESFEPANTVLTGTITYRDQSVPPVPLVYAKLALDRRAMSGLPRAVRDYASDEHLRFPHDPTLEQEYKEDRFIAYRELGWYLACNAQALNSWASRSCSAAPTR